MKRLSFIIVLILLLTLSACSKNDTSDSVSAKDSAQTVSFESTAAFVPTLTVTVTPWTVWTTEQPEPTTNTFKGITEGAVV